jgi:hypothetical protein
MLHSRNRLKDYFKKNRIPTAENFEAMIDSTVNKVDEGFNKTPRDGLILAPMGKSRKVLSFFENIHNPEPTWNFSLDPESQQKGLSIAEKGDRAPRLFLQSREGEERTGRVGVNTDTPNFPLEVNGMLGMRGRIGTLKAGAVPADRQWHQILGGLDGLQAFEVVAEVRGIKGRGRYCLMHATAMSSYGRSRSKIRCTQAYFGWFWNKLRLRWRGDVNNYGLWVRSRSHFGLDENGEMIMIRYRICRLWGEDQELAPCEVTPPREIDKERLKLKPSLKV